MRTIMGSKIFRFEDHWDRLRESMDIWVPQEEEGTLQIREEEGEDKIIQIKPQIILSMIEKGVSTLSQEIEESADDYRVTILIPEKGGPVYIHITALPPPPTLHAKHQIEIMRGDRLSFEGKDSEWVHQRDAYLNRKLSESQDVVLCEAQGECREGLSSNFFVIDQDTLITADEHIIHGTVREEVLKAASQLDLKVQFECPNISKLATYQEAFITSTTRLVYPVDQIIIQDPQLKELYQVEGTYTFSRDKVAQLGQLVYQALESHSTSFL